MEYFIFLFCLASVIQVSYALAFIICLSGKEEEKSGVHVDGITPVSVLICAHDEEENLKELLPALLQQNHPEFEIIVVNDRSNDNTSDFLRELSQQDHRIRPVEVKQKPEHINGKKFGITLGIKAAKHDWVLLTDADCRPASNDWIKTMAQHFKAEKQIVLGYSPYYKSSGLLNLFIRFESLLTAIQYLGFALLKKPYMGVGRNLAYRRSLFLENKGFNGFLSLTGGDDDLFVNQHATKENTTVSINESSLVYSKPKTTLSAFIRQKIRHLAAGKKYKGSHRFLLGLFHLSHLLFWFVGIPLLFVFPELWWIAGIVILRITLISVMVMIASDRFGDKFEYWTVPLLDFLFAIYYISTGPVALLTKKIRWTN